MHPAREKQARAILSQYPNITNKKLADLLGISPRNVRNSLAWKLRGSVQNDPPAAEEWLEHCRHAAELEKRATRIAKPSQDAIRLKGKDVAVMFMSDLHLGNLYTEHGQIAEDFRLLSDEGRLYFVFLGDAIQGMYNGTKFTPALHAQSIAPHRQIDAVMDLFSKVRRKCLGFVLGNHDLFGEQVIGTELLSARLSELGIPVYGGPCIIHTAVGKQEYTIVAAHKFQGRSMNNPAGPALALYKRICPSATVSAVAHYHNPAMLQFMAYDLAASAGCNIGGNVIALMTGTNQSIKDSYSQRFGGGGNYSPITVVFAGKEHKATGFWTPQEALKYMDGCSKTTSMC